MGHIKVLETALSHFLTHYGGWGLFLISYFDSSFLAFPFINDLLLIKYSSLRPYQAAIYTLECTAGSVLGAYTIYVLTLHGSKLLSRTTTRKEKTAVRRWVERNDILSIFVASLLPPPMPFKVFAVIAGGLRVSVWRFLIALVIGRGLRFAFEAWLGVHYGVAAQDYLKKNFTLICVITVVAVVVATLVYRHFKGPSVPGRGARPS
jgi:membrane protein YqaA with SNARE-associated domain